MQVNQDEYEYVHRKVLNSLMPWSNIYFEDRLEIMEYSGPYDIRSLHLTIPSILRLTISDIALKFSI